jgi:hypothetical protein
MPIAIEELEAKWPVEVVRTEFIAIVVCASPAAAVLA